MLQGTSKNVRRLLKKCSDTLIKNFIELAAKIANLD